MINAARLWAETLGPGSLYTSPLVINVGSYADNNAAAGSYPNSSDLPVVETGLQDGLLHNTPMEDPAVIFIGPLELSVSDHPSQLPLSPNADTTSVLYHEIGHALGVLNLADDYKYGPVDQISVWNSHLKDSYGH